MNYSVFTVHHQLGLQLKIQYLGSSLDTYNQTSESILDYWKIENRYGVAASSTKQWNLESIKDVIDECLFPTINKEINVNGVTDRDVDQLARKLIQHAKKLHPQGFINVDGSTLSHIFVVEALELNQ